MLHGIGEIEQDHHAHHAGRYQITHPPYRQLPGNQYLGGIDDQGDHVEAQQRDEQVKHHALEESRQYHHLVQALVTALWNEVEQQHRGEPHHAHRGRIGEGLVGHLDTEQPVERLQQQDDAQVQKAADAHRDRYVDQHAHREVPEGHIVTLAVEAQQEHRQHHGHHRGGYRDVLRQ